MRLARLVGQSKAMEILRAGEPRPAKELTRVGLVNRLCEDDELRARTTEWAALIATRPRKALQACKSGILQAWDVDYENALRLEGYNFNSTMSDETLERVLAIQAAYDAGGDSWEAYGLERAWSPVALPRSSRNAALRGSFPTPASGVWPTHVAVHCGRPRRHLHDLLHLRCVFFHLLHAAAIAFGSWACGHAVQEHT